MFFASKKAGQTVTRIRHTPYIPIVSPFWRRVAASSRAKVRSNSRSPLMGFLEDDVVVVIAYCLHFCDEDFLQGHRHTLAQQRL